MCRGVECGKSRERLGNRVVDGLPDGAAVGGVHFLFGKAERADALHRSAVGRQGAREDMHESRLASAVFADDRDARCGRDDEIDMVENRGDPSDDGDVGGDELRTTARGNTVCGGEHSNPSSGRTSCHETWRYAK